jgi:hypothetical protein
MANSNSSSIEDRKVERKTLKQRARALFRSPSSYYMASENKQKMRAVARAAADEMPGHRKVGFIQELQERVSTEFALKDSTLTFLTSNWAIDATQQVQQQLDDINMVLVAVLTLALVACCLRAATYCRKFTTRVSTGKQDFDETIKTLHNAHDSGTYNTAFKGEKKQSLENELNATTVAKEEQQGHNVLEMPSQVSTGEEKLEDLDPQRIFEVARSAIEKTKQSQMGDCPSPGSTTASTIFTISTDGKRKDDDDYSIDSETTGDSAKIALFCTSPLEVQEFKRNLLEEPEPAVANIGAAGIPTEDVEESAVLGKDAQAVMVVAMKLAAAFVAVNVFVLARRR